MSPNDKSYTEVLIEVYDKMDTVEQRIVGKVDAIIRDNADFRADLAKGDAKFDAIDDKMDGKGGMNDRLGTAEGDIKTNSKNIKIVGSIEAGITLALAYLGIVKAQ